MFQHHFFTFKILIHQFSSLYFSAYFEERKKAIDPFAKIKLTKLQKSLQAYAEKEKYPLATINSEMKQRTRNTVCKTFHGAGLVVPYNKKADVGYRPLIENNGKIYRANHHFKREFLEN